jgi:hypothetical protein
MYIRRTHANNSATGERYLTYRLVKSERVGGGRYASIQVTEPGAAHFAIEQDHWRTLCARVDGDHGLLDARLPIECTLVVER